MKYNKDISFTLPLILSDLHLKSEVEQRYNISISLNKTKIEETNISRFEEGSLLIEKIEKELFYLAKKETKTPEEDMRIEILQRNYASFDLLNY